MIHVPAGAGEQAEQKGARVGEDIGVRESSCRGYGSLVRRRCGRLEAAGSGSS